MQWYLEIIYTDKKLNSYKDLKGKNVEFGRDWTIFSLVKGKVLFRKINKQKQRNSNQSACRTGLFMQHYLEKRARIRDKSWSLVGVGFTSSSSLCDARCVTTTIFE